MNQQSPRAAAPTVTLAERFWPDPDKARRRGLTAPLIVRSIATEVDLHMRARRRVAPLAAVATLDGPSILSVGIPALSEWRLVDGKTRDKFQARLAADLRTADARLQNVEVQIGQLRGPDPTLRVSIRTTIGVGQATVPSIVGEWCVDEEACSPRRSARS